MFELIIIAGVVIIAVIIILLVRAAKKKKQRNELEQIRYSVNNSNLQQPINQQPVQLPQSETTQGGASCTNCGAAVAGPFCSQCATPAPKPEQTSETLCSQCGAQTKGPFCTKCGTRQ